MILEPPVSQMEDAQLAQAARTDPNAFDALYRRYVTDVYRYCFARSGSYAEAEELTAQTFLAALEGLHRYRGRGSFAAWLFGIARRKCADYQRSRYGEKEQPLETAVALPQPVANPEAQVHRRILLDCVQHALRHISPDRREAIQLRFWGGLSVRETAVVMRRTQGAVKMLVSRGVSDLKERCLHHEVES